MKTETLLIIALILCSTAAAETKDQHPYTIHVIVWDEGAFRDANTSVTFTYNEQTETLHTAKDGSVSFSLLNFKNVPSGAFVNVSCRHGYKAVPVNHHNGEVGVTFNEPSEDIAIEAFAAMGFAAVAAGGGIYYLKKTKKEEPEEEGEPDA